VGPLVTLSVLVTGNHYLFDVAAGRLVTAVGFWAGRLTTRRRRLDGRAGTEVQELE
jgi:membrane-associated phospholipid phosphatase